jgi:ankyrin repeat protein
VSLYSSYSSRCGPFCAVPAQKQETPLIQASYRGHAEIARLLLDNGADPDAQDKVSADMLWSGPAVSC